VRLFRDTFRFTGGEIVGEFLMSLGYLPGAHVEACPVHRRILRLSPPWHNPASRAKVAKAPARTKSNNAQAKGKK
jgi:DNA-3-methyladenine glycosylase I